jgi:hypothetical protein
MPALLANKCRKIHTKQGQQHKCCYHTLSRRKSKANEFNSLTGSVRYPFTSNCSSWVKGKPLTPLEEDDALQPDLLTA